MTRASTSIGPEPSGLVSLASRPCTPGSTLRPDGQAVARAIYKMKMAFPNAPGAGLVTGIAAVTGGSWEAGAGGTSPDHRAVWRTSNIGNSYENCK